MVIFYCTKFGHKVLDCRAYGRNVYVAPHKIVCYKFHNYGHIAFDYRSMIDTPMKGNIDIRYKKVWKTKQEERVNKEQILEIAGFAVVRERKEEQVNKE
jgi:hypothetical protein